MTFRFLGEFASADMRFLPRIGEYFTFYSWFLLGLGLVFQLPVVIFVLARIGLVSPGFLLRKFKYAVLAAFVVSAVITPSARRRHAVHAGVPILGLYLLGVAVAWLFGRPRRSAAAVSEAARS